MDKNTFAKMIDVHLSSQLNLYMSEKKSYDNFDIYFGGLIDDYYWNFATNIKSKTKEEFKLDWETMKSVFKERNLQPVAYLTPLSPLYNDVDNLNLAVLYTDSWLTLKDIKNYPYYKSKLELTFEIVNKDNIEKFIDGVCAGFASDDPEDPYGELSEGYRIALRNGIKVNDPKYKIQHYLVYCEDVVVGTATVCYSDKIACVYNVTTAKAYKKNGIAKELMSYLIKDMAAKGIKLICLQTEKGFYTENIYIKLGFEKAFYGKWSESVVT